MRIGIDTHFITTAHATGNRTYTAELVNALVANNPQHEFILYAIEDHPFYRNFVGQHNVAVRFGLSRNGWIRNYVSLPRSIAQDQLDVAHLLFIAAPYIAAPVVLWIPDLYYLHMAKAAVYEWGIGQLTKWSAQRAAHVVTLSRHSRQDILQTLSLPPERVSITSAAAHGRFVRVTDAHHLGHVRSKLGIKKDYILFMGRTEDSRKNIQTLLDAYVRLRHGGRIAEQLVIAGRHGPGTMPLREKIKASGLQEDILLPGIVADDDVPALMSGAEVFVYAPSFEGFGLPVLEALSCGTPVITSNVTSLPEVAGNAAMYVSPGSSEDMEAALFTILSQPALRLRMQAEGLRQAAEFSWNKTASATMVAFKSVATRPAR